MLTKTQIKYIRSLWQVKARKEHNAFIIEGTKIVDEWLRNNQQLKMLIATKEWKEANLDLLKLQPDINLYIIKESELNALSGLQTANEVMAVVEIPDNKEIVLQNKWYLALDTIQDPGNMGTIIRIADWFGIPAIFCTPDCVDVYNPKVIQAAMGGHLRVNIIEKNLSELFSTTDLPIYGATLDGENIYKCTTGNYGILLIGNESKGISQKLKLLLTKGITIPRYGGAESLNAAVATGIICAVLLHR